jgi:hypothetical protein
LLLDATDFISVNPTTGSISSKTSSTVGTYYIKLLGTLSSKWQSTSVDLSLTFEPNQPASFSVSTLPPSNVQIKTSITYPVPPYSDPEMSGPVTILVEPSYIKSFVTCSQAPLNQLNIKPTKVFQIGEHEVEVVLQDYYGLKNSYYFTLTVYDAPRFSSRLPKIITLNVNSKEQ